MIEVHPAHYTTRTIPRVRSTAGDVSKMDHIRIPDGRGRMSSAGNDIPSGANFLWPDSPESAARPDNDCHDPLLRQTYRCAIQAHTYSLHPFARC